MSLSFAKMHGLGNDFVVIDATREPFEPAPALLAQLADRRRGVGCDQILVIEPPPNAGVDFGYRVFNADGSEVGQCGNGARCLARYVELRGLSTKRRLRVQTRTARLETEIGDDGQVRVSLGVPRFEPADIPFLAPRRESRYLLEVPGHGRVHIGAVGLGNPHAVIAVDDVASAPVITLGEALQHHPTYPERVNVGFAERLSPTELRLRVYERGAGETPACGSGACAAVVVGRLWGELAARVQVRVPGGTLQVDWAGEGQPVWLSGAAEVAFYGTLP
jgi:diaminopimelate epimerase